VVRWSVGKGATSGPARTVPSGARTFHYRTGTKLAGLTRRIIFARLLETMQNLHTTMTFLSYLPATSNDALHYPTSDYLCSHDTDVIVLCKFCIVDRNRYDHVGVCVYMCVRVLHDIGVIVVCKFCIGAHAPGGDAVRYPTFPHIHTHRHTCTYTTFVSQC